MVEDGVAHQRLNMRSVVVVALVIAAALLGALLMLLCGICIWRLRRSKTSNEKIPQMLGNDPQPEGHYVAPIISTRFDPMMKGGKKGKASAFEYSALEAVTNNFHESNKLDDEGSVYTYRARFNDKSVAVVKKLDVRNQGVLREFENEVDWLSKIQHQNIVALLGYCVHGETRFLVHEMMHNGSLEKQLHGPSHGTALTWPLRMKIALDVARGLEYLHEHCNPPLIHRDLRSSNILLDSNFNAKLSGFGQAVAVGMQSKNYVGLSGTLDYIAPEYLLDGKLTDKSDVFAFGVILLELLTGRKPVEKMPSAQCLSIAMPQLTDRLKLPGIVDPAIRDKMDQKHLYQVAAVAVLCVQPEPSYRPLITDVLHSFIPLVPTQFGGSLRDA
ncbi:hypothetical protein Dimus_038270 [Dionaea muscipula]